MKTISKNTRITALIAALITASFMPQNSWAMAPTASRSAGLATQRAAQQLYPTLAPAAQRLGLTGRGSTPAQTPQSLELRNQQLAREQSFQRARTRTAQWLAQQKALEAKKLEQTQARSRTLGQRVAAPRNVGTGIMRPGGSSPFAGSALTRTTGVGFGQQISRSFSSSGNLGSQAHAQALENYNNGSTMKEISAVLTPKEPEQPGLFSRLFGGASQPLESLQPYEELIKKIFLNDNGKPYAPD